MGFFFSQFFIWLRRESCPYINAKVKLGRTTRWVNEIVWIETCKGNVESKSGVWNLVGISLGLGLKGKENIKYKSTMKCCLLGTSTVQRRKGSPVNRAGQLQTGLCPTTWQRAWRPHVPGQGSRHLRLIQARFCAQSALTRHSGLQDGGAPMQYCWQAHTGWPLTTRQLLYGPHGFPAQGSWETALVWESARV